MTLFIVGILAFIGSIVWLCIASEGKSFGLLGIVLAVVLMVMPGISTIPTGYTGIPVVYGKVADYTVDAGLNIHSPWTSIVKMDNREQRIEFSQSAFSSDIQEVDVSGSLVYSIDKTTAMNLYKTVGLNYAQILINPQINEDLKSVISRYTAEGLIINRATLSAEVRDMMANDLKQYGLNVASVAIENIDFTDAFEQAVEAKQVATQTKQRAETEQAQMTMEAQQSAERQRIQAQADADIVRIQAESAQYAGEREAEMNRKLSESLTPELVQYYYAQRWDGVLPGTMFLGSDSTIPMLPIK